jgi:hypothetical protein
MRGDHVCLDTPLLTLSADRYTIYYPFEKVSRLRPLILLPLLRELGSCG